MKKILLLGGTGFVGRHVCEKLARCGWRVTVPTRRMGHAAIIGMLPGVQPVLADVHNAAQLGALLSGHDAVVNLVAILHGTQAQFEHAHVALPQKLALACAQTGVRRVVHVSALGAHGHQSDLGASMYQRSKGRGEAVLLRAAESGALDLTILRPGVIFGAEDRFLNLFAALQRFAPVLPLAGANCRFQPVWVEDVASAVVRVLQRPSSAGQILNLCGPDVLTLRELVQLAGRAAGVGGGRGRPVIALPDALARLQAWLMALLPGAPLMSRDNLDSMRVDNVADPTQPGLHTLGITPASVYAVVPQYLGAPANRRH